MEWPSNPKIFSHLHLPIAGAYVCSPGVLNYKEHGQLSNLCEAKR